MDKNDQNKSNKQGYQECMTMPLGVTNLEYIFRKHLSDIYFNTYEVAYFL